MSYRNQPVFLIFLKLGDTFTFYEKKAKIFFSLEKKAYHRESIPYVYLLKKKGECIPDRENQKELECCVLKEILSHSPRTPSPRAVLCFQEDVFHQGGIKLGEPWLPSGSDWPERETSPRVPLIVSYHCLKILFSPVGLQSLQSRQTCGQIPILPMVKSCGRKTKVKTLVLGKRPGLGKVLLEAEQEEV